MNKEIRKLLIERAISDKPIYYSEIMKRLGLIGGVNEDHKELSKVLADISRFENQHNRPLLSSIATYSPETSRQKNGETHGNGFYELAEELGKGKNAALKKRLYAIEQMAECREKWRNKEFYNEHFNTETKEGTNEPEFFTQEEILFLGNWAGKVYDKTDKDHVNAKNSIMNSLGSKTVYWSEQLIKRLEGYETFNWRMWSQKGWEDTDEGKKRVARFKHYTWARIYKAGDAYKDIFFTIGADSHHKSLVYKLDYYFEKNSELSASQKELCEQLIPDEVSWIEIPFDAIPTYNWEKLIDETAAFIKDNEILYDEIIQSVWNETIKISKLKNRLIKREIPETGLDEIPKRTFTFNGVEIDWEQQNKDFTETGKIGEELVIEYEKRRLKESGKENLANEVRKVLDGEGYDIFSRNIDGSEKKIEVKTTTNNAETAFPISITEIAFSELNAASYALYRVFNLDKIKRVAEFHEYYGNLKEHFLLEGIQFNAFRKKKK